MEKVVPFRTGYGSGLCAAWYDGSFLFVLFTLSSGADGHVSGMIDYDVFGKPVTETGVFAGSAGGSGGISALVFGYAGKPYDPVTGLSDYGFRDYAPTLARFTTVDPIRDGSNWYAYCNSDPVNYVDMWGLTASDSGGSSGQYAKWNKFVSDFDNSFYSIINGDFGLDQFANGARAWSNGDYGNAVLYGLSGVAEAALDMALVYTGAKAFGAFVGEVFSYVSSWFTAPEAEAIIQYGPMNKGPLPDSMANTFRGGSYSQVTLQSDLTLYRVYGGTAEKLGSYWSKTAPKGPLQSTIDLALKPDWGNTADNVVKINVPAGTTIFEGFAESQGGALLGGGSQVIIPNVDPGWVVK